MAAVVLGAIMVVRVPAARLPLPARLRAAGGDLATVFQHWLRAPRAIAQTLVGSVLTWTLAATVFYALITALGGGLGWLQAAALFPIGVLAGMVPLTVSGIGTRDSAFVFLLGAHIGTESATLVGLGYTVFGYWLVALIGLPLVLRALHRRVRSGDPNPSAVSPLLDRNPQ